MAATAAVSLAPLRAVRSLGTAKVAMIMMIAITINSSMSEKPARRRRLRSGIMTRPLLVYDAPGVYSVEWGISEVTGRHSGGRCDRSKRRTLAAGFVDAA